MPADRVGVKPDAARQLVGIESVGGRPELADELRPPLVGEDALERGLSPVFSSKVLDFCCERLPGPSVTSHKQSAFGHGWWAMPINPNLLV